MSCLRTQMMPLLLLQKANALSTLYMLNEIPNIICQLGHILYVQPLYPAALVIFFHVLTLLLQERDCLVPHLSCAKA